MATTRSIAASTIGGTTTITRIYGYGYSYWHDALFPQHDDAVYVQLLAGSNKEEEIIQRLAQQLVAEIETRRHEVGCVCVCI